MSTSPRPPVRSTYTFAELEISAAAYDEIAGKLRAADYGHVFTNTGNREPTIDMHGIGLTRGAPQCTTCDDTEWVCEEHMDKPWGGVSNAANACECGPGAPCPVCYPRPAEAVPEAVPQAQVNRGD